MEDVVSSAVLTVHSKAVVPEAYAADEHRRLIIGPCVVERGIVIKLIGADEIGKLFFQAFKGRAVFCIEKDICKEPGFAVKSALFHPVFGPIYLSDVIKAYDDIYFLFKGGLKFFLNFLQIAFFVEHHR